LCRSAAHVECHRKRSTLCDDALKLFSRLVRFHTRRASHGEALATPCGDVLTAFQAAAVSAFRESLQGKRDLVQRFRLHLKQCEFNLLLGICFRTLAFVEDVELYDVVGAGARLRSWTAFASS